MAYTRKTRDIWEIYGHYPTTGKECVTTETSWADCRENLRLYRENEPGIRFTYGKARERIEPALEISVTVHSHDGFTLATILPNGDYFHRRYMGYTRKEARALFKEDARQEQGKTFVNCPA